MEEAKTIRTSLLFLTVSSFFLLYYFQQND